MDDADIADEQIQRALDEARYRREPDGPQETGFCLYEFCREAVDPGHRWCEGTDCRDAWAYANKRRLANGG